MNIASNVEPPATVSVKHIQMLKTGSIEDLKEFLDKNATRVGERYHYLDWSVSSYQLGLWEHEFIVESLADGFIKNIDAETRLKICLPQESISPEEQKSRPQHILYDDDDLIERISNLFRMAFGQDIFIDFRSGKSILMHVGEQPSKNLALVDRVSNGYVSQVRKSPRLDMQGDGMKSYAGILFETIAHSRDITLIDEPEAFLHPPQMRRLGQTLAENVVGQLIVATHSSDIMRGFLEGAKGNVRILRIDRDGDVNNVTEAPAAAIKELWDYPQLRYSNALDGIFHEQVIICEDDSDCRLFNSIADFLELENSRKKDAATDGVIEALEKPRFQDTAYIPAGGKQSIPRIAKLLRDVGVPVKAVFDMDFLSDEVLAKEAVEAFGGSWDSMQPTWKKIDAAIRKGKPALSVSDIKDEIVAFLKTTADDELPRSKINEIMKQVSPWSDVKKYGRLGIPKGQIQEEFSRLESDLRKIGIYLVPAGEVENHCPEVGGHGPKFVTQLLSDIPLGDGCLSGLREFVDAVHSGSHGVLSNN